jgi:uncharacterized protein
MKNKENEKESKMIKKILMISLLYVSIMTIGNVYGLENGVTIPLVADRVTTIGEEGSYLNAQVVVTNGTGHVFVDTNPFTQVDLQGSARIAAMVASDVLGVNEKIYDFYYIIEIDSPVIGGPSAGGALTVATIAAINNWTIRPGVAMTGMIDPDETIGPVGGIPYKLQAAADKGITLFLVPQGQLVTNVTNFTVTRRGSSIIHNTSEETVDIGQLGNKLNVTVKEVETIQDAVLEFTGHDISKPSINETVFTPNYLSLLQPLAIQLKNESNGMYRDVYSTSGNNSMMKNAEDLQNRADVLVNDKKYYAATSLYFLSIVNILTVQWRYDYDHAKNKEDYMANLTDKVRNQITISENDLVKFKSNGTSDIEVIGAAESRIMEANNTLENLNESSSKDMISSLAFAYERSRTAQWWLSLASPSGKIISKDILEERSEWYLSQAQSINAYVQALLTGSGISIGNMGDTTIIQKEIDRGFYSGAIFDSLKIISILSTGIELAGVENPSIRVNQSEEKAQSMINEVRSRGIEPTLAVSVYEFGGTLTSPYEKKSEYFYARMIAKVTESLYSHEILDNNGAMPENETMVSDIKSDIISNIKSNTTSNVTSHKSPAFDTISLIEIIISVCCLTRLRRN